MANFRALTIQSGITTQQKNGDSLVVGSGVTTAAGNLTLDGYVGVVLAASKNLSASGTSNFDFSGSTGTFSTSTGAVTVGGAATFTAAGTALTVSNNATVTGVLTATGGVVTSSVDSAGVLTLGGTTATSLALGKVGVATRIYGNLQVDGTETVIGISNFQQNATFGGEVTVSDGYNLLVGTTGGNIGNFTQVGTGTFGTGTGAVSLNGDTTVASGKTLTLAGMATAGVVHNAAGGLLSSSLVANADIAPGTAGQVLLTNGTPATAWTSLSQDATVAGDGKVTVVSSNGAFSVGTNLNVSAGGITQAGGAVSLTANAASSFTTSAGALTLTSAAAATWSTAAGILTLNGTGGLDLQTAGANRLVVTDTAVTVQSGVTLVTTGTGMIDLPVQFKVAGTAVSANVTAAALTELTGGGLTTLHAHAGAVATSAPKVLLTGLTTTTMTDGYNVGYVSGNKVLSKAVASGTFAQANVFGVSEAPSTMTVSGQADVLFEAGLTPAFGDYVYLSPTTAGRVTNVAPSASGEYVTRVGIVLDATAVTTDVYPILLQPLAPLAL